MTEAPIRVPAGALVVLVGAPAAGKSTFAAELVRQGRVDRAAVVSSDDIAVEMFGPAVDRSAADPEIFGERDRRVIARLEAGLTTVVDATNVRIDARARLQAIARRFTAPVVVLRFDRTDEVLVAQNAGRGKRLPVSEVRQYAALMAAGADAERLRSEDVLAVHDVPGRDRQVGPAQAAARFEFDR
jgi:predicted kinase